MNNKGFTLIEVIMTVGIIAILTVTIIGYVGSSFSINKDKAYELMKENIISASYNYISECDNDLISCNYIWQDDKTSFKVSVLKSSGYINNLESPIDGTDLSNCLVINATKDNGVISVNLSDNCY